MKVYRALSISQLKLEQRRLLERMSLERETTAIPGRLQALAARLKVVRSLLAAGCHLGPKERVPPSPREAYLSELSRRPDPLLRAYAQLAAAGRPCTYLGSRLLRELEARLSQQRLPSELRATYQDVVTALRGRLRTAR